MNIEYCNSLNDCELCDEQDCPENMDFLYGSDCTNGIHLISEDKAKEIAVLSLNKLITDCKEMAKENWSKSYLPMLDRLFGAVLEGCKYDEWKETK